MMSIDNSRTSHWQRLPFLSIAASAMILTSSAAFAGECPPDQVGVDVTKPGPSTPKGETDSVIASIDLSAKPGWVNHLLRMRRIVVEPGGVVPWHNHGERPANIYVVEGSIKEHRSTCAVPIEHKAGEAVAEFGADLSHWWKNDTKTPVVLISADLVKKK